MYNLLAIFLAALSAFFLGFFWYTVIFAKTWQKLIGMKAGKKDGSPDLGKFLIGSFILELLMAFTLSIILGNSANAVSGLQTGLQIGLGCVGFAFGVNYMFEGKSTKLWFINAGYNTIVFAIMGLILGAL